MPRLSLGIVHGQADGSEQCREKQQHPDPFERTGMGKNLQILFIGHAGVPK